MTVCIAAICDDGKSAVVAADRMIVFNGYGSLQFEGTQSKIVPLSARVFIGATGTFSEAEDVISRVKRSAGNLDVLTVSEIAEKVRFHREEMRTEHIEKTILNRLTGGGIGVFRNLIASSTSVVLTDIYNQVRGFRLEQHFFVVGIDNAGAHIHTIDDSGLSASASAAGCAAIGSGNTMAMLSLARNSYKRSFGIADAVYLVYEAKRSAEMAYGVGGNETDLAIIRSGQPHRFVKKDEIAKLEKIRTELKPPRFSPKHRRVIENLL
jgi:20S proteasome alpha/beta subunit